MKRLIYVGLGLFALITSSVIGIFIYYGSDSDLPTINSIHDYKPLASSKLYDRQGHLISTLGREKRTVVPYAEIPKVLVQAVISAEDSAFFRHSGLDYLGMLRAFFANLKAGGYVQGGSTITQQVVKTFFLTPQRTIRRKVQEVILAQRLESALSKQEILYLYLNQIYFGHGRYGVQEASRFFFNKDVKDISLVEAAMLAGLPQAPQRLSPIRHPDRAKRRRAYVLQRMKDAKLITESQAKTLAAAPLGVQAETQPFRGVAPEIMGEAIREIEESTSARSWKTSGIDITTTVDGAMQKDARAALRLGLRALDERQKTQKPIKHLNARQQQATLRRLRRSQSRIKAFRDYTGVVIQTNDAENTMIVDLGSQKATVSLDLDRYNPKKQPASKRFRAGDLVRVSSTERGFTFDPGPQGIVIALDPQTGDVLAMVSGYSFNTGDYNRAVAAKRQPGSSFKPIVYLTALDSRRYTPATIVDDAPVVYRGWEPRNFDGKHHGPLRLRTALARSINTVSAKLTHHLGLPSVRTMAKRLGITSPLGDDMSIALGSAAVTPLELALAYCVLANGGKYVTARYVLSIAGRAVEQSKAQQVISAASAYVMTHMMTSVIREGTARRAATLGRPAAGKTGTTNDQIDAWFVGFTPQLVTAVWVGFDRPRSLGPGETGGRAALPIWLEFMKRALKNKPIQPFTQPTGVVVQRIDTRTGLLAANDDNQAVDEVFLQGTEPQEVAPRADEVDPDTILMNAEADPSDQAADGNGSTNSIAPD